MTMILPGIAPTHVIDRFRDWLGSQADSYARMSRRMAEDKSRRQPDNPEGRTDLYESVKAENTMYGKLASLLAMLKPIDIEKVTMELAYAFAEDTHGDHIKVWWSSIGDTRRAKYLASTKAALGIDE